MIVQYEVDEQWGIKEKKWSHSIKQALYKGMKQVIMTLRLSLTKSKWALKLESLLKSN